MRFLTVMALLMLLLCGWTLTSSAQGTQELDDANTVAMLKASYLYNFSKHSDWPVEYKQGNFVIGISGADDIYDELVDIYATKSIGSQALEIQKLSEPYDLEGINVVFIGQQGRESTAELVELAQELNSMIITDLEPRIKEGTIINFRVADNRIQFEVNLTEAERRGIMIGEKIKSWAYNKQ